MLGRSIQRAPRRWLVVLALAAAVVLLPLAWYLGSPLFIDVAVNEQAPTLASGPAAEPRRLAAGQFGVIDALHRGEGEAVLLQLPNGQRVLRFERFRVTNGPDLYVYLSGHPAPRSSAQLYEGAAFEVATLKGNIGDQNYELLADLDLGSFRAVVIYCQRFATVFSTAELALAR